MVNWRSNALKAWKTEAFNEQVFYCRALGNRDYDEFKSDQIDYLDLKIAIGLYGPPKDVNKNEIEIDLWNYDKYQRNHVRKLRKLALSKSSETKIRIAFIFLSVKQYDDQYQVPLLRVLGRNSRQVFFIDHLLRVYNGWDDFQHHNLLPKCIYCAPQNGEYVSDWALLGVRYCRSPRCSVVERVAEVGDAACTVIMLGSIGVIVGSYIFPPAAALLPAVAAANVGTGVYSLGRSAGKLVDRQRHEQSIDPFKDAEAAECWLGIASATAGLGSAGILQYMKHFARSGGVASKALRVAYSCFGVGGITLNGMGIVLQVMEMNKRKGKVSLMQWVNLSASIFFFTHSIVNLKSARTIFEDVQRSVLAEYEASFSSAEEVRIIRNWDNTVRDREMHRNARFIRSLRRINNLDGFSRNPSTFQRSWHDTYDDD